MIAVHIHYTRCVPNINLHHGKGNGAAVLSEHAPTTRDLSPKLEFSNLTLPILDDAGRSTPTVQCGCRSCGEQAGCPRSHRSALPGHDGDSPVRWMGSRPPCLGRTLRAVCLQEAEAARHELPSSDSTCSLSQLQVLGRVPDTAPPGAASRWPHTETPFYWFVAAVSRGTRPEVFRFHRFPESPMPWDTF